MKVNLIFLINFLIITSILIILYYILFSNSISPVKIIIGLILYSISLLIIIYIYTNKNLHCCIIFIPIIRGTTVIFLYFTRLINSYFEKKNLTNFIYSIYILLNFFIIIIFSYINIKYFFFNNYKINISYIKNWFTGERIGNQLVNSLNYENTIILEEIYKYPLNLVTFIIITYLILTLFWSSKICFIKNKPLRKIKP